MQRATSNFRAVVNCRSLVPFQNFFLSLAPSIFVVPFALYFPFCLSFPPSRAVPTPPPSAVPSRSRSPRIAGTPATVLPLQTLTPLARSRANFRAWFACHAVNLATGPQKTLAPRPTNWIVLGLRSPRFLANERDRAPLVDPRSRKGDTSAAARNSVLRSGRWYRSTAIGVWLLLVNVENWGGGKWDL